jgi:hypothetical protein
MKSMRDCKTQEEKDELMRKTFLKMECEIKEGYHYVNNKDKIPFLIVDKSSLYYGLHGKMFWNTVSTGRKWNFMSINQEDKDLYLKVVLSNIGCKVDTAYHYKDSHSPIPFIIIDKNNEFYNLHGYMSWSNIIGGKIPGLQSLYQEDRDHMVNTKFSKLGIKALTRFSNIKKPIDFIVIDKNNRYFGLKGKVSLNQINYGGKWDFRSIDKHEQNKFIKHIFNEMGINPLEKYSYMRNPILFEVIDKYSPYYGLKGKFSFDVYLRNHKWNSGSLLFSEWKKYVDSVCRKLNYNVISYPKKMADFIIVETMNKNRWKVLFNCILRGIRCPLDTNASFGERCLTEIFKLNKIKYEYQRSIHYNDKSWQNMDFYLPDYNMCIEYNGIQHYDKESNLSDLKYQHQQDLKKYKYCMEHNIKYYEVPFVYDTINKITEYVSNKLLHKTLLNPEYNRVQYSSLYNDYEIIKAYYHYRSHKIVSDMYNISVTTVGQILKRYNIKSYRNTVQVVKLNDENNIISIYSSMKLAKTTENATHISCVCKHKRNMSGGYKWEYLSNYIKCHPDFNNKDIEKYMIK